MDRPYEYLGEKERERICAYLRGFGRNHCRGVRWSGAQQMPQGGGTWGRCLQGHGWKGQGTVLRPWKDQRHQNCRSGPGVPGKAKGWAETCGARFVCWLYAEGDELALPKRLWAGVSCLWMDGTGADDTWADVESGGEERIFDHSTGADAVDKTQSLQHGEHTASNGQR